jgi:hypothetical protein
MMPVIAVRFRPYLVAWSLYALTATVQGDPTWLTVLPHSTDPQIRNFNTPHWICVDHELLIGEGHGPDRDRHELLVFLPGTGGHGRGPAAFLETAAALGYRVISLMYPDDVAAAEVCRDDSHPEAFEKFRMAIIQGGSGTGVTILQADSIENRLQKLLIRLQQMRPKEGWSQFLDSDSLAWNRIAFAGQSQGGGHAALIAVKHRVSRVLMFGSPKDYSRALGQPAAWYTEPRATSPACFFALNHSQDRQGCTFRQQLSNLHALGVDELGPMVDVDREVPPYHHSHILVTNYPGTKVDSKTAHGTALAERNKAVFAPAWRYMLTEPVPIEDGR